MPDDFGELEQEVMERIEDERASGKKVEAGAYFEALDYGYDAVKFTTLELTPAQREGLSTRGARIPASDDRIGLVDPADGTLKMYSRAEIRARVKPCPPGVAYDDANGYAGTFEKPLRPEVQFQRVPIRRRVALAAGSIAVAGWITLVLVSLMHAVWP